MIKTNNDQISDVRESLKNKNYRDFMLFEFYIRNWKLTDLIKIKVSDVPKREIEINDRCYTMDDELREIINVFLEYQDNEMVYLFSSKKGSSEEEEKHLDRQRAYDILNEESKRVTGKTLFDLVKGRS